MSERSIEVYQPWSAPLIYTKLPDSLFNSLIEITDLISREKNPARAGHGLAGEIEKEFYIDTYLLDKIEFTKYIENLTYAYTEIVKSQYHILESNDGSITSGGLPILNFQEHLVNLKISTAWFNDQQDHEYNPVHNHNGLFSGVLYLKIPEYLPDRKQSDNKGIMSDGQIMFVKQESMTDYYLTRPTINFSPKPKDLFLFPSVLLHTVTPFRTPDGKGVRRSMSFNIEDNNRRKDYDDY